MKLNIRKSISKTSILLFIIIVSAFIYDMKDNSIKKRVYVDRAIKANNYSVNDAFELYRMLRMNVNSGQVERKDYTRAEKEIDIMPVFKALKMNWVDMGPDNIGGRTRAILIDRINSSVVYAGSVSGGLFKSTNGGGTWKRLDSFFENLSISTLTQTISGRIYVGTGHLAERSSGQGSSDANGAGLFYSDDNGASFSLVPGTDSWLMINEIVADVHNPNKIWIACSQSLGFKTYDGSNLEQVSSSVFPSSGIVESLSISGDGSVIICGINMSGALVKTFVSEDGGGSWSDASGAAANGNNVNGGVPTASSGSGNIKRVEYAISDVRNSKGNYSVYACTVVSTGRLGQLEGVYVSEKNGLPDTWYRISESASAKFEPLGQQGLFNCIISVKPGNPDVLYMGGLDIYKWTKLVDDPPFGSWDKISDWRDSELSSKYIHADQHEIKWDVNGNMYVGSDGGVAKALAGFGRERFFTHNRFYNVTQFYNIAFSSDGDVVGGSQDNGTLLNEGNGETDQGFKEIWGGDGFSCEISHQNKNYKFLSSQYGNVVRTSDNGINLELFIPKGFGDPGVNLGSFYTSFVLFEDPSDKDSKDNIVFPVKDTLYPGDEIKLTGLTFNQDYMQTIKDTLWYADTAFYSISVTDSILSSGGVFYDLDTVNYSFIGLDTILNLSNDDTLLVDTILVETEYFVEHPSATNNQLFSLGKNKFVSNFSFDTLIVQDTTQSLFALGLGTYITSGGVVDGGVHITRDALRTDKEATWFQVINGPMNRNVKEMEFSKDGNHLYISTWGGQVWRVSGLDSLYTAADLSLITSTLIYQSASSIAVTGIGVDPQDAEHVIITVGGFGIGNHVFESLTAVSASNIGEANFVSIQNNLPDMPAYDIVIDRDESDKLVLGTEFGVFTSDDGGVNWTYSDGPGKVPVFDVKQQWRTWQQGAAFPGEIYIGTHGRGIWKSSNLVGVPNIEYTGTDRKILDNLLVFPNPVIEQASVSFDLHIRSNVELKIYSLSGKLIESINHANVPKGNSTIEFNATRLPSGTYLVQVTAGGVNETGKFIVR